MKNIFVYITTKDKEQAQYIGRKIVEERIAACVNIIDNIQSIYHWQGKICEDTETILIAKTKESLFEKLSARVKELHSYEVPCIVALPIEKGYSEYLKWINDELMRDA